MPLLGISNILTLVVKPTVGSIGVPLLFEVFEVVEAVIMSTQVIILGIILVIMTTQGFVISLPYCFLNSEVRGAVRSQWRRWQMVRCVYKDSKSLWTISVWSGQWEGRAPVLITQMPPTRRAKVLPQIQPSISVRKILPR